MTIKSISFVLLCEGSSDEGLRPHLETLLIHFGAQEATGMTDARKGPIATRLGQLFREGADLDMVFIHRDSDGPDRDRREREIQRGVEDSGFPHPHVPVIPVQETEAWLLLDEQAIRNVVARPSGKQPLRLPKPNAIEGTRNPKEILQNALLAASGASGRRLRKEKNNFSRHREVLLQRLDPFGAVRGLPSWQCLERDIQRALAQLGNQN